MTWAEVQIWICNVQAGFRGTERVHTGQRPPCLLQQHAPHDFGIGEDRNPVYEWDGAGYSGWEHHPACAHSENTHLVLPYEV